MTYRLLVRRAAKSDIHAAARWYELQRSGLGRQFVAEVDGALARLAAGPLQYQVLHRETRRVVIRRFPYAVFYRVEGADIVVLCVTHLHRHPTAWKAPR